jgi:tryptophan 2-monooxygenase
MPCSDETPDRNGWRFKFPNAADFNFNYWKLLHDDDRGPVATAPTDKEYRIGIIGAGVAGITAARELFRAGYKNIDIYEAEDRIGGRTWSKPSPPLNRVTTYELGAMRLPFFWPYDDKGECTGNRSSDKLTHGPGSKNCVLDYYCTEFEILTQPFPNPGAPEVITGIYAKRGRGLDPPYVARKKLPPPSLILFDPDKFDKDKRISRRRVSIERIYGKWKTFEKEFHKICQAAYSDDKKWRDLWKMIVEAYQGISFRRFVQMKARIPVVKVKKNGKLLASGLGMNGKETRILAVIGLGDGGWGAFYEISALWVLRTMLFGFCDKLQLIEGKLNKDGTLVEWDQENPKDSLEQPLVPPSFLGIQSLVECLFYMPPNGKEDSLYSAVTHARERNGVHLYTRNPVRGVTFRNARVHIVSDWINGDYDAVIITPPPWSLGIETAFDGFDPMGLPWAVREATDLSHFISSCKVFFPLKERYWNSNPKIPQVIITDTFVQGVYGIAVRDDPGVLLASYTWEDDATKLIADTNEELAQRCLEHLDSLLERCQLEGISRYVNKVAKPEVHHWARSRWYRGCSRLYRPGNWELDRALLVYNRDCSGTSHIYLAGEAYSVEGGWVEPALRSALDAVIHLVKNTGGSFRKGFNFDRHYPKYDNIPTIQPTAAG